MVSYITDSMDMSLSKLWKTVKDGEKPGLLQFMELQRVGHNLVTENSILLYKQETTRIFESSEIHMCFIGWEISSMKFWRVSTTSTLFLGFIYFLNWSVVDLVFPGSSVNKASGVQSLGQTITWRRKWQPTPGFLSEKSHEQKSLAGYGPWGCKSWTQLSD